MHGRNLYWALKAQHELGEEPTWPTPYGYAVKRRSLRAGADDYITKPFDEAELIALLRRFADLGNEGATSADDVRDVKGLAAH